MNCVRKHLSAIKGGRLAARCAPARVVTLPISDVPGDDPAVIASGPTVPDADHLRRCAGDPAALRDRVAAGRSRGARPSVLRRPSRATRASPATRCTLIATPQASLEAAAAAARAAGIEAHILSDEIEGESRVVGQVHAALARGRCARGQPFAAPCVILSGGETTVTVKAKGGRGGRATEFLLGAAHRAARRARRLRAGGRHRRHRRRGGQRRRDRHARHAGARRGRWA